MKVYSEVFFTKIENNKIFYIKKLLDLSGEVDNPDKFVKKLVKKLASVLGTGPDKAIIHSTSWRYSRPGEIVLTYLAYSDFFNIDKGKANSFKIKELKIKSNGEKSSPTPKKITEKEIVSHGIRHISFLIKNDPKRYKNAIADGELGKFLKIQGTLAGGYSRVS